MLNLIVDLSVQVEFVSDLDSQVLITDPTFVIKLYEYSTAYRIRHRDTALSLTNQYRPTACLTCHTISTVKSSTIITDTTLDTFPRNGRWGIGFVASVLTDFKKNLCQWTYVLA